MYLLLKIDLSNNSEGPTQIFSREHRLESFQQNRTHFPYLIVKCCQISNGLRNLIGRCYRKEYKMPVIHRTDIKSSYQQDENHLKYLCANLLSHGQHVKQYLNQIKTRQRYIFEQEFYFIARLFGVEKPNRSDDIPRSFCKQSKVFVNASNLVKTFEHRNELRIMLTHRTE